MLIDQELNEMDRVTQLQDAMEQLFHIMGATLNYLRTKAGLVQVSSHIPVTKSRGDKADAPDIFLENQKELVADFVRKAKEIETLINSLPEPDFVQNQAERLVKLEEEMKVANEEYRQAVERAKSLHKELQETLRLLMSHDYKPPYANGELPSSPTQPS
ncbi:hypothetical protein FRC03_004400 [Tulasnella sp. 419]|nr:hypothetical protein FRC02_010027 [Tulasnella sp. 418]KAG8962288.1 hypothetical protein FRC03_004400 [Tulasnella sp. 419]